MIKQMLYAGAAAALVAVPSGAMAQEVDGDLEFNNYISTGLVNNSIYNSVTGVFGLVTVSGNVEVDSSANAITDTKQIINGNIVTLDDDDDLFDFEDDTIESVNESRGFDVDGSGNIAVNAAAGQYNMQSNIGTIAVSTSDSPDADEGGMAHANTTAAQSTTGTFYGSFDDDFLDDDESSSWNRATGGNINGSGNVGVNIAAGAFNSQQNLMTLAVANDSSLAEASAGVVQLLAGNAVLVNDQSNVTDAGTIGGAGNVAVNAASGVGNMQHNSLTISASGGGDGGF